MTTELELFVFSASPTLAAEVAEAGAAGVVVDWEQRGKRERQNGFDTQIGADTPEDLRRVRAASGGRVLCRLNGWGPWTANEMDVAVGLGADELLLPMVRRPDEVDRALDTLAGRCGLGILIETVDAVACGAELASRPLTRIYVGLNDLMIDRGGRCLFTPLVDGTVDELRDMVTCPFGVAGLTVPGSGAPVPSWLLAAELARLRADFTFLRRSFLADVGGRPLAEPLAAVSAMAADARRQPAAYADADRQALLAAVSAMTSGADAGDGPLIDLADRPRSPGEGTSGEPLVAGAALATAGRFDP